MFNYISGKKTYIIGTLSIIFAWSGYYLGHNDLDSAIQMTQVALTGMGLRHGMAVTMGKK